MIQSNKYDHNLFKVAQEVYHSLQVVLEFMDKGMKGLLTGDLSVYIIQQIQTSIEHFQRNLEDTQHEIEELLQKQISLEQFYNDNFAVGGIIEQSVMNTPTYEKYQNFEQYLVLMERSDWKKHVQLKDKNNYTTPVAMANVTSFINPELLSQAPVPAAAQDAKNQNIA